jgi:hypothetical protein
MGLCTSSGRVVVISWSALFALLCASCTGGGSAATDFERSDLLQAGTVQVNVPLPPGTPLSSVALGANSTLLIGSNVSVGEEGSPAVLPTIANAGTGTMSTTQTGVNLTSNIWSVGSVFLATGTTVAGSVSTAGTLTEQTGVTVKGAVSQHQSLSPVTTTFTVTFPASTTNVTLQPNQTSTISPGAFAAITVNANATLTLQSGTY